ncbi:MAG: insulinase family protein [Parachlamydiales bacterium]|jgi:hypothetical protein
MSLIGKKYNNFIVTKQTKIEEIKVELIELKHIILGCDVIKIKNDDDENLFSLSFKTYPHDSTGSAHVLEHIVLCGSKKFPVKDPFFSMLKRSLATFMNAMTGSDFTCYPASSLVEKDFYNLLDVYIDAVFHPTLSEMSFLQEGHRFEFSNPTDGSSDLLIKGIVYNEMKGSMANPDNILHQKIFQHLTPDLPYCYNSGGDPKKIIELTYENLKKFHEKFYHPSRCLFFLYGNLDLEKQLNFIEEKALKNISKQPPIPNIVKQKRFSNPKTIVDTYPIPENETPKDKSIISFGFLTCSIENQLDIHALSILDNILMGTDGSYLKLALLQSNLCQEADSYFDTDLSEAPYIIVCKGCDPKNQEAIFNIITETLNRLVKEQIPKKIIDAALHQLEFSRKEISHDFGPYGLVLFFKAALAKQHGIDAESTLLIHSLFNTLKKNLDDPTFIPNLISKYFLDNSHYIKLTLKADNELFAKEMKEEQKQIQDIQKNLTPSEIEKILSDTEKLSFYQKELESSSLECLPKIEINDVPKKNKNFLLNIENEKNFKFFHHDNFTNEILYADLLFDFPKLDFEDIILLPLFSSLLTEVGAGKRNYIQNLEYIEEYTGGIDSYLSIHIDANDFNKFTPSIAIKSKALYRNSDKMFALIKDVITDPIFTDSKRIKELLMQQYSYLESSRVKNSMKYAISLSQSNFTKAAFLLSAWHGIDYYNRLKEIINNIDAKILSLIDKLNSLKSKVLCINNAHLVLSCCDKMYSEIHKNNFYGLLDINFKKSSPFEIDFNIDAKASHVNIIPSPVAFTATSYKTIGFMNEDSASLLIASQIFENVTLHKKIREQGGAYGSSANYSPTSGIFTFSSFRDPHIKSSLDAFKESVSEIANGNFSQENINEAKLGIIQQNDTPISPGSKAIAAYTWLRANKTDKIRQKFREKILSTTKEGIIKAVKAHLLSQIDDNVTISFCGKELLEKEKINLKNFSK